MDKRGEVWFVIWTSSDLSLSSFMSFPLSFQISCLWDSQISLGIVFQLCSLLCFLICRNMKKKKNPEGVWSYAHSSLKIKTKFLQQIMNSKFTLPPSKKKKKKKEKISCLMVCEAQNVLLVLVSSSKGETQNPSSRAQFLFLWLVSLSWDFVAAGFCSFWTQTNWFESFIIELVWA